MVEAIINNSQYDDDAVWLKFSSQARQNVI